MNQNKKQKKSWRRTLSLMLAVCLCVSFFVMVQPTNAFQPSRITWMNNTTIWPLGVNYAWYSFNNDFTDSNFTANWTSNMKPQIDAMAAKDVHALRWWLFPNGWAAPLFSGTGHGSTVTGLPANWVANMKTAADYCLSKGIKIYFTFTSFDIARNNNSWLHDDIIYDATVRQSFLDNCVKPILQGLGTHEGIMGWDVVNEPEWMISTADNGGWSDSTLNALKLADVQAFVKAVATYVHTYAKQPVSVGSASMKWTGGQYNFWMGLGLDFYDFHWYDWATPYFNPLARKASTLGLDKPVIIGEMLPNTLGSSIAMSHYDVLQGVYNNGYAGYMPWAWTDANCDIKPYLTNEFTRFIADHKDVNQVIGVGTPIPTYTPNPNATPTPKPIVDNFESYNGSYADLQAKWNQTYGDGGSVGPNTDYKNDGSYSMRYDYTIGSNGYTGKGKTALQQDWTGNNAISFWLKPDGSGRTLTVQFAEGTGEYWETGYTLTGTDPVIVTLPFSSFKVPSWYTGGNGVIDLDMINTFNFYVGGSTGSGSLYFDTIAPVVSGSTTATPTPTPSTATATPTPSATNTVTPTPTNTVTPTATPSTATPTPTPSTATPTPTPSTATPTPTPSTATPTPTPSTATPTPTPSTATPTPTPTPTAGTPAPGGIKVQFFNGNTAATSNTLYTNFKVVNTGTAAVNLSDVKMRYYFTNDGTQANSFACDYSSIGSGNVTGSFTTIAKTNADRYLEVGFTSAAGSLAAGANIEVKARVWKSDWSNFTQTNDYSFNATATNYVDSTTVTGYIAGALKWGTEP